MAVNPQTGDVIVQKIRGAETAAPYGVGIYEGPTQFAAPSHNAARDHADKFARQRQVDVWYTDDDQHYSCVAQFRSS